MVREAVPLPVARALDSVPGDQVYVLTMLSITLFCERANHMVSQISFLICQKGIILAPPILSELKKTLQAMCQTIFQFTNHRGTLRTETFYLFFRLKTFFKL